PPAVPLCPYTTLFRSAMGWMMLTMVEGISRSEGGVGAMLLNQNKHFHLSAVFAIQISILFLGLGQDYAIGLLRRVFCPYATLTLDRKSTRLNSSHQII